MTLWEEERRHSTCSHPDVLWEKLTGLTLRTSPSTPLAVQKPQLRAQTWHRLAICPRYSPQHQQGQSGNGHLGGFFVLFFINNAMPRHTFLKILLVSSELLQRQQSPLSLNRTSNSLEVRKNPLLLMFIFHFLGFVVRRVETVFQILHRNIFIIKKISSSCHVSPSYHVLYLGVLNSGFWLVKRWFVFYNWD